MAQKIEQYKSFYFALLIRQPLLPFALFRIGPPHRPQRNFFQYRQPLIL
jgi:hypothetical protein